jgi:hypothetical protein
MKRVDQADAIEIERLREDVRLAEAAQRLLENDDFQLIFEKLFYEDWLLTQGANFHLYDMETRKRFLEQLSARSIVKTLMSDVIEQGRQAKDVLNEMENEDG